MTHPIIEQLREVRRNRNLSQDQLSAAIGTAQNNLCRCEKGHHFPRLDTISAWAEALGFEIVLKARS